MPRLGRYRVTITDVTTNEVTVMHVRRKEESMLPGAQTTVPHRSDSRKVVDFKTLPRTEAKRVGLLGRLFGRGQDDDSSNDDPKKGGGSAALEWRW